MKNLEKLANYKLENEKLNKVFGGIGSPVSNLNLEVTTTVGGERCDYDEFGNCYIYTYSGNQTAFGLNLLQNKIFKNY